MSGGLLFNVLQIADRLLTSFGQDIMDAFTLTVQESCENWNAAAEARRTAAAAAPPPPQSVPVPEPVAEPEPSPPLSVRPMWKDSEGDLRRRRPLTTGQSTRPASISTSTSANAEGAERTLTSEELEAELPDDEDDDRAVPEARAREDEGIAATRTLPTSSPTNAPPSAPRASGSSAPPPRKARVVLYSLLDILPHFALAALYVTLHSMLFLAQVRKRNVL